jgi:hypothetical protein
MQGRGARMTPEPGGSENSRRDADRVPSYCGELAFASFGRIFDVLDDVFDPPILRVSLA